MAEFEWHSPSGLTDVEISGLTADSRAVEPGYLFAALPGAIGLISVELSGAVLFTVVIYILVFEWFVIRIALQTTAMTAAGIVLLLETVGVLINLIAYG